MHNVVTQKLLDGYNHEAVMRPPLVGYNTKDLAVKLEPLGGYRHCVVKPKALGGYTFVAQWLPQTHIVVTTRSHHPTRGP